MKKLILLTGMNRKKIKVFFSVLVVLLVVHWNISLYMNYYINKELSVAIKEGQITSLSQLVKPFLRKDNRASLYTGASELVDFKCDGYSYEKMPDYYKNNREQIKSELSKRQNQIVLDVMDQVMERKECNFNLEYDKGFAMHVPNFLKFRNVAQLLSVKAMDDIEEGNYDMAVRRCAECLAFGGDLCNEHGALINHMIGLAIINIGIKPLNYMFENKIKADYTPAIRELSSLRNNMNGCFIKSLESERTMGLDVYRKVFNSYLTELPPICISDIVGPLNQNVWFLTVANIFKFNPESINKNVSFTRSIFIKAGISILNPYILADKLNYVRTMNYLVSEVRKNPSGEITQKEINKYYIVSSMIIPNIVKAHNSNREFMVECNKLVDGLKNI